MKEKILRTARDKKEIFIIFLCWLAYTCAYLGKYSYTSNTAVIGPHYGVTKAEVGLVSSFFFVAYGVGQIVNALLCKFYPKKFIISFSLAISAIINIILFFNVPFKYIKYLWLLNACVQSILWPTLVQIISTYVGKNKMKSAVLAMATTVATGTILSYVLSAICVQLGNFKVTFMVTGVLLVVVAVLWFIGFGVSTKNMEKVIPEREEKVETAKTEELTSEQKQSKKKLYRVFYITLFCLAIFAVINNFVKDGLNTWVPNILKEMYNLPDSLSIILTVTLSILGIFGAFTATFLNKYIKNFVVLCGVFFLSASAFEAIVLGLFNTDLWLLVLICFGIISLLMHAINNVITSMFALYMPDNSKAGLYSGLLNGACYVGSALSAYGLGLFADNHGWMPVFQLLLGCCVIPVVISIVFFVVDIVKKHKAKKVTKTEEM